MPPNRFESEVESFLEGSHGDRTHIKRADHPRLHHYAGRYCTPKTQRTRRDSMATLKPTTPLRATNKGPLKPTSPLHPKTAPKTPISHPQRRWRFQTTGPAGLQGLAATPARSYKPTPQKTRMQFDWERFQQRLKTLQFQRSEFKT